MWPGLRILSTTSCWTCCYVLQMSDTLDLSAWATCRLVAGLPSLLNTNYDTIRNRWVGVSSDMGGGGGGVVVMGTGLRPLQWA